MNRRAFLKALGLGPVYAVGGVALLGFVPAAEAKTPYISSVTIKGWGPHPLLSTIDVSYNPTSKPSCGDRTLGAWEATWSIGDINYGIGCKDKKRLLQGLPSWVNGSVRGYENMQRLRRS